MIWILAWIVANVVIVVIASRLFRNAKRMDELEFKEFEKYLLRKGLK